MRYVSLWSILTLAILAAAPSVLAAEAEPTDTQEVTPAPGPNAGEGQGDSASSSDWQFIVTPYLWASAVGLDQTVDGTTTSTDIPFSDLLSNLDIALQVHAEARRNRWGFYLDQTYVKVSPSGGNALIDVDVDLTLNMTEFGASYALVDKYVGASKDKRFRWEAFTGARWVYMKPDTTIKLGLFGLHQTELDDSFDWLDWIVGTRLNTDLSEKWGFLANVNAGGFGIGSSSELTWDIEGLFRYSINDRWRLFFGYRYLNIDYDVDSSSDIEMTMDGPLIGFGYEWKRR